MSFPREVEIRIAILREIKNSGGLLRWDIPQIYDKLASYFPNLTHEDRALKKVSGNLWQATVRRVRGRSEYKGLIEKQGANAWLITADGERHLQQNDADMRTPLVNHQDEDRWDHDQTAHDLKEAGELMSRHAEERYDIGKCQLDVVWKRKQGDFFVTHAFEVHHSGNLKNALTNLTRVYEQFVATRLFLVCNLKDQQRAREINPSLFDRIVILRPSQVSALIEGLRDLNSKLGTSLSLLVRER